MFRRCWIFWCLCRIQAKQGAEGVIRIAVEETLSLVSGLWYGDEARMTSRSLTVQPRQEVTPKNASNFAPASRCAHWTATSFCRVVRVVQSVPMGATCAYALQVEGWIEKLSAIAR